MSTRLQLVVEDKKTGQRIIMEYKLRDGRNPKKQVKQIAKLAGVRVIKWTLIS